MSKPVLYKEAASIVLPRVFLEETAYASALQAFVLVCTDCVFVNRKRRQIYLARRKAKPLSDWWFIGGRVYAGEGELHAMCRCLERETKLQIDPDRLCFLTMKRYIFKDRQQQPQDIGCDSLCYIFALNVTDEEARLAGANLDPDEYDMSFGLKAFGMEEFGTIRVFPPVIDIYEYLFGDAVPRKFIAPVPEEWAVLVSRSLRYCRVRTQGNIEGRDTDLLSRLPMDMRKQVRSRSIGIERVAFWSELSVKLGTVLHICTEDSRGFDITVYYVVFPDGTVVHMSLIDQRKHEERRLVMRKEKRTFFKTRRTAGGCMTFVIVPLPGVDCAA
jgi:ADP-ribose pyrophosphatase YjhB (NUDIX family)